MLQPQSLEKWDENSTVRYWPQELCKISSSSNIKPFPVMSNVPSKPAKYQVLSPRLILWGDLADEEWRIDCLRTNVRIFCSNPGREQGGLKREIQDGTKEDE